MDSEDPTSVASGIEVEPVVKTEPMDDSFELWANAVPDIGIEDVKPEMPVQGAETVNSPDELGTDGVSAEQGRDDGVQAGGASGSSASWCSSRMSRHLARVSATTCPKCAEPQKNFWQMLYHLACGHDGVFQKIEQLYELEDQEMTNISIDGSGVCRFCPFTFPSTHLALIHIVTEHVDRLHVFPDPSLGAYKLIFKVRLAFPKEGKASLFSVGYILRSRKPIA